MPPLVVKPCYGQITPPLLLRPFERYLAARELAPATCRLYRAALLGLAYYVPTLEQPTAATVRAWLAHRRRTVSQSSLNVELSACRRFYAWAFDWEYLLQDYRPLFPVAKRVPRRLPNPLDPQDIDAVLSQPDLSSFIGLRDYTILRLMYETGLQAPELIQLTLGDILPDNRVFIQGTRRRAARAVPYSSDLSSTLKMYTVRRQDTRPGKSNTLFVNHRGKPFHSPRGIWALMQKYRTDQRSPGSSAPASPAITSIGPDRIRASFAAHLLASGCDLVALQVMLGHACIASTAAYEAVNIDKLKAEHAKCFAIFQLKTGKT